MKRTHAKEATLSPHSTCGGGVGHDYLRRVEATAELVAGSVRKDEARFGVWEGGSCDVVLRCDGSGDDALLRIEASVRFTQLPSCACGIAA